MGALTLPVGGAYTRPMTRKLRARTALLRDGWADDVLLETDRDGLLTRVEPGAPRSEGEEPIDGVLLPGVPNLHSHAFQRGMAGSAEGAGRPGDTFWEWRERMYGFLRTLGPDEIEAVATRLFVEMLRAGYTSVGEFHYLHHPDGGGRYDDAAELSLRIVRAASRTGISLTHLPALYRVGGLEGDPLSAGQRRFACTVDELLEIADRTEATMRSDAARARAMAHAPADAAADRAGADGPDPPGLHRIGLALHSLRAVPPEQIGPALRTWRETFPEGPVHVHVAEQIREVEACLATLGARPVEWLLENALVDERWCLVHATHMTEAETDALAGSGAVAGLCPTTEANLGDGLFPLSRYLEADGRLGVGSDSHASVDPVEEMRWLEYGQRLHLRRRGVAAAARLSGRSDSGPGSTAADSAPSTGRVLLDAVVEGGARALGQPAGGIAPGRRLDAVVVDPDHPLLVGREDDRLLDAWIFSGNERTVRHVLVGGRWVVRDGRHALEEESAEAFRAVIARTGAG